MSQDVNGIPNTVPSAFDACREKNDALSLSLFEFMALLMFLAF